MERSPPIRPSRTSWRINIAALNFSVDLFACWLESRADSALCRILSTLRGLAGFVWAYTCKALFPILLALGFVLSGAACRGDDTVSQPPAKPVLDDSDASSIAGTIQGSFAVSSTGEATYTLPLMVPPGAAGMQPSLAVAYNSASGDGMLGVGFSLTGFSAITRCPLTMAEDKQIRGVRYDQHDGLCLDGARLLTVGSSNGVVEYRTFPDTFVKVLATPSKVAGNPADTFKVFARSGLILELGTSADSRQRPEQVLPIMQGPGAM